MATARVVYKLKYPVALGEETITEVALRRPKGKDLRAMRDGESVGESLELIGRLCGQPKNVIDELDAIDIQGISEIVDGFAVSSPPTGDAPSQS